METFQFGTRGRRFQRGAGPPWTAAALVVVAVAGVLALGLASPFRAAAALLPLALLAWRIGPALYRACRRPEARHIRAIVPLLNLGGRRRLLDVGGGPATWAVLIAQANPGISCTVLDLPPVVAIAAELVGAQGMSERIATLAGDYHEAAFPPGNDVIHFFGMLHQESPDEIRALLRKAYDALEPGGLVQVLDIMSAASRTQPRFSALFGLNMALTTRHGWVFSDVELRGWLEEAGFVDFSVAPVPPPMPHWLARARKPS